MVMVMVMVMWDHPTLSALHLCILRLSFVSTPSLLKNRKWAEKKWIPGWDLGVVSM